VGIKEFASDQPILAGCLGLLSVGLVASCGLGALAILGAKGCMNAVTDSMGVDSFMDTVADAAGAGYSLGINSQNGQTVFEMIPMAPQEVTCDDLKAILLPHLTGALETVVVYSESGRVNADGSYTGVPVECTWSGFPGGEGGALMPLGKPEALDTAAPAEAAPPEAAPTEAPSEPAETEAAPTEPAGQPAAD